MENDKEAKSQESRLGWSIFLSIILHFVFIFLILHFYPDVPKTENKVITVRLAENQVSISQEKSSRKTSRLTMRKPIPYIPYSDIHPLQELRKKYTDIQGKICP